MKAPLQPVRPGSPLEISAGDWNAIVAAARSHQVQTHPGERGAEPSSSPGLVWVRNDSGADRARFEVLGIDGPIISHADNLPEFKRVVALKGITPTVATHLGRMVVLDEPLKSGVIGRAAVSGVCPAQINIIATADKYADVANSSTAHLESRVLGSARILWKATSGTGVQWCIVHLTGTLGIPAPGVKYQVLSVLDDDGNRGWDWVRAHV